ncbi:MAG: hypothetical protein ACKO2P_11925 [Planctomycetota bacterium]
MIHTVCECLGLRSVAGKFVRMTAMMGVCLSWGLAQAQLPATRLEAVHPSGAAPGQTLDVTLIGGDLDDASVLQFSHGGITAARKMAEPTPFDEGPQPVENVFTVTVAANVPPGEYDVRCQGRFGFSNTRRFSISSVAQVTEVEPNGGGEVPQWVEQDGKRINAATEATLPAVLHGQSAGQADVDWYRFSVKAGQRVVATTYCRRMDSRMTPVLTFCRGDGAVLAESQTGLFGEAVAETTAGADGEVFLKVHDIVYAQGPPFVYRILVAAGPQIDMIFPPAGLAGSNGQYLIYGRNLPGGQPSPAVVDGLPLQQLAVNIGIPGDAAGKLRFSSLIEPHQAGLDGFEYQLPGDTSGSSVLLTVATAPPVIEQPNERAESAQKLTLPCEVMGQFYPQRDVDWYEFTAVKDEVWSIDVISQRLGLMTDPSLFIQQVSMDDKGEQKITEVAVVDDLPVVNNNARTGRHEFDERTSDPSVLFKVPADGVYRILLRDALTAVRSDPRLVYRLAIRRPQPDFRIAAVPAQSSSGLLLRRGGREAVRLLVWRQDGYDGEIRVTAAGLPEGVTAEESIIGPGNNFGMLTLTAADGAKGASDLVLTAKALINGSEVQREVRMGASTSPSQPTQPGNNVPSVRSRLVSGIRVSVSEFEAAPQTITIGTPGQVIETARGGVVKIPWEVRRADGTAGSITGFPLNIPPGTTAQQVNIGGNPKGEFELRFTSTAVPGTYSVHLAGFNQGLQYKRYPEMVDRAKERQTRVAKVLMEAQQKVQMLTQENQKLQNELTAANTALTAATTASQQADQKATAAATALQQAETALKQKQEQSAANPADETLKKQAADALTARDNAKKADDEAKKTALEATEKLKVATEKRTMADAARTKAQTDLTAAQQFQQTAQQEKTRADQFVNQKQQEANPRALNVELPSNAVLVKLAEHPLTLDGLPPNATIAQGAKAEVVVRVGRKFDSKGPVTVQTVLPPGVAGLQIPNATVPENQGEVKFEMTAAANATVGEHAAKLRLQINFNGQTIVVEQPLAIRVNEAKAP